MSLAAAVAGAFAPSPPRPTSSTAATASTTSAASPPAVLRRASTLTALHEVDDERHPVEAVARAQPVLEEVGVVARDTPAAVDLHGEARRVGLALGHVDQLQPVALLWRRLAGLHQIRQEAGADGR